MLSDLMREKMWIIVKRDSIALEMAKGRHLQKDAIMMCQVIHLYRISIEYSQSNSIGVDDRFLLHITSSRGS
jgi:hypothetical protein